MRISDWSSDVCSSDLLITRHVHRHDLKQEIDPPRDHVAGNDTAYIQHGRHERISHFLGVPLDVYAGENRQAQTHRRSGDLRTRSEEHTSELQSLMRISYAVFCLNKQQQPTHSK